MFRLRRFGLAFRRVCSRLRSRERGYRRSFRSVVKRVSSSQIGAITDCFIAIHGDQYSACVDAPVDASGFFGRLGKFGQVLSCVQPLDAARHTPRTLMEMRGPGPNCLGLSRLRAAYRWTVDPGTAATVTDGAAVQFVTCGSRTIRRLCAQFDLLRAGLLARTRRPIAAGPTGHLAIRVELGGLRRLQARASRHVGARPGRR